MQEYKDKLKKITEVILKQEDNYGELTKAIDDLYKLFIEASGLDMEEYKNRENIFLTQGKAIGPVWAAMCVREILRTKRFIRGFYLGIKSALERFTCRPIHILYAGTGPFATLAIPLTTVFNSEEISFTMLEINTHSIQLLEKIIEAFQAEEYAKEIVRCDATIYKADTNKPFHMIITETMQNALQKEPQVKITMNLVPQMEPEGILIPQNIKIEAVLLDSKKNKERMMSLTGYEQDYYHVIDKVFELNKNISQLVTVSDTTMNELYLFKEKEIEIPKGIISEYRQLCLFTTIQVFEEEILSHWQCSLTLPKIIMDFGRENNIVDKVSFQYVLGDKPGFNCYIKSYA